MKKRNYRSRETELQQKRAFLNFFKQFPRGRKAWNELFRRMAIPHKKKLQKSGEW